MSLLWFVLKHTRCIFQALEQSISQAQIFSLEKYGCNLDI